MYVREGAQAREGCVEEGKKEGGGGGEERGEGRGSEETEQNAEVLTCRGLTHPELLVAVGRRGEELLLQRDHGLLKALGLEGAHLKQRVLIRLKVCALQYAKLERAQCRM